MEHMLERADFEAWLREKQPFDRAGIARSLVECPLASYLFERYDAYVARADVDQLFYMLPDASTSYSDDTPEWAVQFMEEIDALDQSGINDAFLNVTAEQALAALASIPEDA